MDVAWGLCWGGSRSTKPCVFPCKVADKDPKPRNDLAKQALSKLGAPLGKARAWKTKQPGQLNGKIECVGGNQ